MQYGLVNVVFFAVLGGLLPAVVWLWFWLKEDKKHPEPKRKIFIAFVAGMAAVPVALFAEVIFNASTEGGAMSDLPQLGFFALIVLAVIEESSKYVAASWSSFRCCDYDEPVDSMIYLISAALGFAALENTLFLIKQFELGWDIPLLFFSNNLRFIGATLLHVVSSGMLGGIVALSFYKGRSAKILYFVLGLTTAVILHAGFNFFIIQNRESINTIFYILWIITVVLILFFEKVKSIKKNN